MVEVEGLVVGVEGLVMGGDSGEGRAIGSEVTGDGGGEAGGGGEYGGVGGAGVGGDGKEDCMDCMYATTWGDGSYQNKMGSLRGIMLAALSHRRSLPAYCFFLTT